MSTVYIATKMPDGSPFVVGTTYYAKAVAVNDYGSAPESPEVEGQLDTTALASIIASEIVSGFVLTGSIQVGQMTIDANTGITIPQPDGGSIHLPVDGTDATVTANVIARSLTIEDNTTIGGIAALVGILTLNNGISAPVQMPSGGYSWPEPLSAYRLAGNFNSLYAPLGFCFDASGNYVFVAQFNKIYHINATTGVVTTYNGLFTNSGEGGITRLGTNYYVLGLNTAGTAWVWEKFTDAFAAVAGTVSPQNLSGPSTYLGVTIGNDGTDIIIAKRHSNNTLYITKHVATTGLYPGGFTAVNCGATSGIYYPQSVAWLSGDFGATRIVVYGENNLRTFDTSGVRQSASEWTIPSGGYDHIGVQWDGTRWHTGDQGFRMFAHSTATATQLYDIRYAWLSQDGTTVSLPSPLKVGVSRVKRAWLNIYGLPSPPEYDQSGALKANRIRVYAALTGVATRTQSDLALGGRAILIDAVTTGGALVETVNGFASVPGQVIGVLQSEASDGGGPIIELSGDGSGRVGPYAWDTAGVDLNDTGWVTTGITYGTNWSGTVGVRKVGKRVFLRNSATRASGTSTTPVTLPAGYRPDGTWNIICRSGTLPALTVAIGTDGVITVGGAYTTGDAVHFSNVSFFIP
jgi:hypothetical protein